MSDWFVKRTFLENGGGDAKQKNHVCEISPEFCLVRLAQSLRQFSGACLAQRLRI
jgi:hypothetical protein